MLINWSFEALKWKYLLRKNERIPFFHALKAIMTGITVSIFTPNRVGDYLGRVFFLKKVNPWKAVLITLIGNVSQLLTTILFGSLALIFFIPLYLETNPQYTNYIQWIFAFVLTLSNAFLILFYFNVGFVNPLIQKIPIAKGRRVKSYFRVFEQYTLNDLLITFFYSAFRYMVFNLQFYLLLKAFGVDIPIYESLMISFVMYFILTAIPTIALAEIGIRGSIALTLFKIMYQQQGWELGILSASGLMWLINLALPALIGAFFVYNLNFFRKQKPEKNA